jgi:hypothetical protein
MKSTSTPSLTAEILSNSATTLTAAENAAVSALTGSGVAHFGFPCNEYFIATNSNSGGHAAMIKDIVVNLNVGAKASPASDFAISVAAAFDAHLTGIAFLHDPIVPVSGAGHVPAEVIVTQQDYQAAVRAARERFAAASARALR